MICSLEMLKTEIDKIKKILAGNGYPLELINRVITTMITVESPNCLDQRNFLQVLNYHIWETLHVYLKGRCKNLFKKITFFYQN